MSDLSLAGLKVVEFTHMVMGPAAGAILVELGATSIKIEPLGGDPTRRLSGSGAGYFPMYNRGKQSLCVDLKSTAGRDVARRLVADADILVENFGPGALDRLGLGYDVLAVTNPRLIYCSLKGFLPGPYAHRTALDEVAQMMGGLAYMTGPPGRPLRAGASVIDVAGGMFGVIAILAAVEQRHRTGRGQFVQSALFETTAYFVGQHMAQAAVTGAAPQPMPVRISAWAIYDIFTCAGDEQLFIGVVSDAQWRTFCDIFDLGDLGADPRYATNDQRVASRDILLPRIRAVLATQRKTDLIARLDPSGLPFAPIVRPDELFDDPHLRSDGLVGTVLAGGIATMLPVLPIEMADRRTGQNLSLPASGGDARDVLTQAGYSTDELATLIANGVVGGQP